MVVHILESRLSVPAAVQCYWSKSFVIGKIIEMSNIIVIKSSYVGPKASHRMWHPSHAAMTIHCFFAFIHAMHPCTHRNKKWIYMKVVFRSLFCPVLATRNLIIIHLALWKLLWSHIRRSMCVNIKCLYVVLVFLVVQKRKPPNFITSNIDWFFFKSHWAVNLW